jgi:hypothetical protein
VFFRQKYFKLEEEIVTYKLLVQSFEFTENKLIKSLCET